MEWLIITALILFGLGLIIIEVSFVPGTTFVGVAGLVIGCYGLYMTYNVYGTSVGHLVLAICLFLFLVGLIVGFKTKSWERFSLHDTNTSRFNQDSKIELAVGQEGTTISAVKPVGKASFDDHQIEVRSNGLYIRENVRVKITRIEQNKIYIEPIT